MSHLLELLGRGLIGYLSGAFAAVLGLKCEETTDELRYAAERDPDDLDSRIKLAGRHLQHNEPVAARQAFLSVLAKDRKNLAARLGLACVFDELQQFEIALEQLRIAQRLEPGNAAVLFCLAYCHERLGRQEEAIRYYQDALSFCPTLRNAHERLAAIYLHQDRLDLAIHHYGKLCELDPEQADLHLTLANLLLKAGDPEGALRQYEHALTIEPDNWTVRNDAVTAYEEAGLIREAIEHLHMMLDRDPDHSDTRLRLGDLYARIGDDAAAVAQYQKAVELCPDYLEANVKLGTQHLRAGRYEEAAKWFSFALEINDRLLGAYVGIGVAQNAAGRRDEALSSFEMARNIEPNSTLLFSEVARMQLKAAASQQADKFLAFDEASPAKTACAAAEPLTHAASGSAKDGQATDLLSQQIDRLRQAVRTNPNHADLHYRLGLLLRNRGQIEDAIKEFREAVEINPCYVKALIKLGLALSELDRTDEAIEVLRQATEIQPDYLDLHYQLGLLFVKRHQFEIAIEHYEHAAHGAPHNVAFQANLALALQNMGLIDRATASWQIVQDIAPQSPQAEQARTHLAQNRGEK